MNCNAKIEKISKDFEEEVKPLKDKIEELMVNIREYEEENEELNDEIDRLNDELSECDLLIEYIRELEKEVYIYQNKNLEVKTIVDELLYKVKCIKGDQ